MARMKDLHTWFMDKYDIYDEETDEWQYKNMLFLVDVPPKNGEGIRIVIKHNGDDPQTYFMDLYKGTDYTDEATPDDMFKILTDTIDNIMVNMPKD